MFPDEKNYCQDARNYRVVPVCHQVSADFETPLSIFLKADGRFLLESIERGENVGRYSFVTCGQKSKIVLQGHQVRITEYNGAEAVWFSGEMVNPLQKIREYFKTLKAPAYEGMPPFCGGAIGYLGYETVQYFENVPIHPDRDGIPDGLLVVPELLLVYDSVQRSVFIIAITFPGKKPQEQYRLAEKLIAGMAERLKSNIPSVAANKAAAAVQIRSEMTKEEFAAGVNRSLDYIRAGDIYQVVMSQRFVITSPVGAFEIYKALRNLNPSPYLFYLNFDDFCLIGSSPEVMVRVQNNELLLKPIAGTRPRGATLAEDNRLANELLQDPKECAEHIMLVDLGRNDLGRVAKPGSVEVTDYMVIERYSHVMHIVSNIKAELDENYDVFDVIRSVFPAGTLSGAPKIRAMEIIHEIEPHRRGFYGGMVFNLGFNGNLDSCITIRTILHRGDTSIVQAGAGIVADSRPENEFQESLNKAGALIKAIEMAAQGRQ
jgi:anthranilate synthase component 1